MQGSADGHDPELLAARFLGADLDGAEKVAFVEHLLDCADCWSELEQGRRGRSLAESLRTVAPARTRERLRSIVALGNLPDLLPAPHTRWVGRRVRLALPAARLGLPAAGLAAAAAVALVLAVAGPAGAPAADPAQLRSAMADFAAGQLPGKAMPAESGPDLSTARLAPLGAAGGTYGGLAVVGYAYRGPEGQQVTVYLSDEPFPEAGAARHLHDTDGVWVVQQDGLSLLCASTPRAVLIVGRDAGLVEAAAAALGVV